MTYEEEKRLTQGKKRKTYSNVHEGNIALKNIVIFGFAVIKIPK